MFVKQDSLLMIGTAEHVILGNPENSVIPSNPCAMLDPQAPLVMRLVNAGRSEHKVVRDWQLSVSGMHIDCHGMDNLGMSADEMVRMALRKLVACRLDATNFYVGAVRMNELGVPNLLIGRYDMPEAYANVIFGNVMNEVHLRFETLRPEHGVWAQDLHVYSPYERGGWHKDCEGRVRQWLNRRRGGQRSDCRDLLLSEAKATKAGCEVPVRHYTDVPVTPVVSPHSPEFD